MRPSDASAYIDCLAAIIVTRLARSVVQISSHCEGARAWVAPEGTTDTHHRREHMQSITRRALASAGRLVAALMLTVAANATSAGAAPARFAPPPAPPPTPPPPAG